MPDGTDAGSPSSWTGVSDTLALCCGYVPAPMTSTAAVVASDIADVSAIDPNCVPAAVLVPGAAPLRPRA